MFQKILRSILCVVRAKDHTFQQLFPHGSWGIQCEISPRPMGHGLCQGAVFMMAKFEVFLTLSLKTFTHFTFSP